MNIFKISMMHTFSKYKELVTPYLAVLLIPLVLCFALYAAVHNVITQQIESLGTETADSFQAKSAAAIQEIYYLSDALCNDEGFLNLISRAEEDLIASDTRTICSRIENHLMRSNYVGQVKVFCENQNSVYSPYCRYNYASASSLLGTFSEELSLQSLSQEEGWHILTPDYLWPYYVRNIYSIDGNHLLATMIISIDTTAFLDIFMEVNADLAVLFNEDFHISSYLKNIPAAEWHSEEWVSNLLEKEVRCFYIDGNDFSYMIAISVANYNKPLHLILVIFAIYYVTTLIIGLLSACIISHKRYASFVELISELPQDPDKDLTYHEIMNTIKTNLLRNRGSNLPHTRHLRYILRGYYDRHIPSARLEEAGINIAPIYRVVLFNPSSYKDVFSFDRGDNFADARRVIIEAAINSALSSQISAVVTNIDLAFCAVYSFYTDDVPQEEVRAIVQNTLDLLEQKYGMDIVVTVSAPVYSADDLHRAYKEADDIYTFIRVSNSELSVILHEDISSGLSGIVSRSFSQDLQTLINALQLKKYSLIPQMTSALLSRHIQQNDNRYRLATDRLRIISCVLSEQVLESNLDTKLAQHYAVQLSRCTSVGELESVIENVFAFMEYEYNLSSGENADTTVQKACKYISDNLCDPSLSVYQICENIDISYPYLSRLFRKELNSTVVQYINANRISKAKELLITSTDSMTAIADAVGYNNTVTFTRNFKHYVGITPSNYRELNVLK